MIASSLILVEPTNFLANPETLKDNEYMNSESTSPATLNENAIREHMNFQLALTRLNVPFKVYKQQHPDAFDSIFACDWAGSIRNEDFPEGIVFLFPLKWPSRRKEKNEEILKDLLKTHKHFVDLSYFEETDKALESFGVLVPDFHNRIIYVNLSERCHKEPAEKFVESLNKYSVGGSYVLRIINARDPVTGTVPFHTQMYLYFNDDVVFFCKDFVPDEKECKSLVAEFTTSTFKYNLIDFSYEEAVKLGANVVEVRLKEKNGLLVSKSSYNSFSEENRSKLRERYEITVIDVDTINSYGGGSLRCMCHLVY
jgi:hypothetical protein